MMSLSGSFLDLSNWAKNIAEKSEKGGESNGK